jgi:Na+-driven multidrug efflux pump
MLLFLPFNLAGFGAIGSFFLGIGRTQIVPVVVLLSNMINIILGLFLIFGWGEGSEGVVGACRALGIPEICVEPILKCLRVIGIEHCDGMGARGAAYATGIAQVIAFLIFLASFLKQSYRQRYHTHRPGLSIKLMKKCLPLGITNAINSIVKFWRFCDCLSNYCESMYGGGFISFYDCQFYISLLLVFC